MTAVTSYDSAVRKSPEERFWAKVSKGNACWIWMGGITPTDWGAYGAFWDGERLVRAHRWAYENVNGPTPDGLVLDHRCRVTLCVNPEHLEAVTQSDNIHRGLQGVLLTHCRYGHQLSGDNLQFAARPNRPRGAGRRCRTCANAMARKSYYKLSTRPPRLYRRLYPVAPFPPSGSPS